MANTEKFLNSSGLSSLWAKIKSKFYTKTEVDALIPEDEVMWVTITGSDAPFSVNKTFDEIYNHVHNGGVVYADWDGYLYAPLSYDSNNYIIEFGGCDITDDGIIGDYFYIEKDSSGNTTISRMYAPINASNASPLMDGTVNTGSSMDYARADHVHPSDTSRVAVAQGTANAGKYLKVNNSGNVAVADLDTEVLVVTFTYDRYENNSYIYIADKSNTEITNAYSAGKIVMGKMQDGSGAYFFNGGGFFATQPDEDYPIISYFYYYGSDYEYSGDFISLIDSNRFYNSVLTKTNTDSYTPTGDYNPATKKYVDDSIPENELFIVTLTVNGNTYTANKTLAQINEAVSNGKHCIAIQHNSNGITDIYNYAFGSSTQAYFFNGEKLLDGYFNVTTITYNNSGITKTTQQLPTDLIHMSDTTISSPTEGQVLAYDSASSKWINTALSSDVFLVTITGVYSEGEWSYNTDKNINDIISAYNNGKACYATYNGILYYLTKVGSQAVYFSSFISSDEKDYIEVFSIVPLGNFWKASFNKYPLLKNLSISSSPQDGQVIMYNDTFKRWEASNIAKNLVDLSDTTITSPVNGQVLTYDSTTSKWINTNALTETRVNELITAALAQYGDGDTASYGYTDASEVNY